MWWVFSSGWSLVQHSPACQETGWEGNGFEKSTGSKLRLIEEAQVRVRFLFHCLKAIDKAEAIFKVDLNKKNRRTTKIQKSNT